LGILITGSCNLEIVSFFIFSSGDIFISPSSSGIFSGAFSNSLSQIDFSIIISLSPYPKVLTLLYHPFFHSFFILQQDKI